MVLLSNRPFAAVYDVLLSIRIAEIIHLTLKPCLRILSPLQSCVVIPASANVFVVRQHADRDADRAVV